MNTLVFYWSLSSQTWSLFSFIAVLCVLCHRRVSHRVECRSHMPLFKSASNTGEFTALPGPTSLYTDFAVGPCVKTRDLSSSSMSWQLGFVTSERFSGFHQAEGAKYLPAFGAELNRLEFLTQSHKQQSLSDCARSQGSLSQGVPGPNRPLSFSTLYCQSCKSLIAVAPAWCCRLVGPWLEVSRFLVGNQTPFSLYCHYRLW